MNNIPTIKFWRSLEALLEILVKLFGTYLVFISFKYLGQYYSNGDFSQDTLLSILLLPTLYILKDAQSILDPFFVEVKHSNDRIKVNSGIIPRFDDTLELSSVDNIEITTTPFGRWFNFATITLYGRGGSVVIPFVVDAQRVSDSLKIGSDRTSD